MSQTKDAGLFRASCLYDEAALRDFEALYRFKKEMSPGTRAVLGVLGAAGCVYFGWMLYRDGFQITRVAYLLICSLLLVLAFPRSGRRQDDTASKYRKAYLNRHVTFAFDDAGFEMRLEGQKNHARSKYGDVNGLFDTDRSFYFVIQGRAYYILPKDAVADGRADELKKFMERKCKKRFQHFDLAGK